MLLVRMKRTGSGYRAEDLTIGVRARVFTSFGSGKQLLAVLYPSCRAEYNFVRLAASRYPPDIYTVSDIVSKGDD
jgi:hypothetical protein